jgi:hypothetical protein
MEFSIGNLVSAVEGAVAKVATTAVNTVSSAISGIAGMFESAFGALESAVFGAMAMVGVVDVDGDGELDLDDAEEFLEEKFKVLVGASIQAYENLKNSDEIMNDIKGTYPFQWGLKETQNGEHPTVFGIFGFDIDENGVYHAKQDALLQSRAGYTDLYDEGFDLACNMGKQKFEFSTGNEDYMIWLWKGDYLNLGAGAETGIYKGGGPWLDCDINDSMPMTLRLEDEKGNTIYDWKPQDNNWWCTGFNPKYQNEKASNITSYGSIDFSNHLDLWDAFYKKYDGWAPWSFDPKNHIATYEWKN